MIDEKEELQRCASRWREWRSKHPASAGWSTANPLLARMADAYLAVLDSEAAIAAERALLIDWDWLESNFHHDHNNAYYWINDPDNGRYDVQVHIASDRIVIANERKAFVVGERTTTTRGMMLDFLAGLRIKTRAQ